MFRFPNVLYPITDTRISGLSHPDQIKRLCQGGARLIQLREKSLTPAEFERTAREALQVARSYGARIIINDRVDIARALNADGVHLGQGDIPPAAARRQLGDEAVIGLSVHNVEQAAAVATQPISYLGVGPIYPTATKTNPDPVIGLSGLLRIREITTGIPLVAIGGIDLESLAAVLAAGADAVAPMSAILRDASQITALMLKFINYSRNV